MLVHLSSFQMNLNLFKYPTDGYGSENLKVKIIVWTTCCSLSNKIMVWVEIWRTGHSKILESIEKILQKELSIFTLHDLDNISLFTANRTPCHETKTKMAGTKKVLSKSG